MKKNIRIVIADDHPIFRKGLRTILESVNGFDIVAEAENGVESIEKIREYTPDVAVLDVDMPEKTGVQVVEEFRKGKCATEFVFLTMFKEKDLFDEAIALDVKGYVLKDNALTEITNCVKAVVKKEHYISPTLSSFVVQRSVTLKQFQKKHPTLEKLTPTEIKIVKQIASHKTSKEIAAELNISVRTVEHHRAHIAEKLNIKGAQSLLKFAVENKSLL
ncbi:MAG: response regulator transcription factor [Bacteriovoracaceae bacterium]|nr:response regulator transcription factor [Bacteroidota bacterium]